MPIYEYDCQNCGTRFDTLRSFAQADLPMACSVCQSSNTKRALSLFNASSEGRVIAGKSGCGDCSSASSGCAPST